MMEDFSCLLPGLWVKLKTTRRERMKRGGRKHRGLTVQIPQRGNLGKIIGHSATFEKNIVFLWASLCFPVHQWLVFKVAITGGWGHDVIYNLKATLRYNGDISNYMIRSGYTCCRFYVCMYVCLLSQSFYRISSSGIDDILSLSL